MNRDCGCQHHARNIIVDPFTVAVKGEVDPRTGEVSYEDKTFPFEGMESNVQNALELLFSRKNIESIISWLENVGDLKDVIKQIRELANQILNEEEIEKAVLAKIAEFSPKTGETKGYVIEEIMYNPKAYKKGESLYYQGFFTKPDSENKYKVGEIQYPHITENSGIINEADVDAITALKEFMKDYSSSEEGFEEYFQTFCNVNNISETGKTLIEEKIQNNKEINEWDIKIITDFLDIAGSGQKVPRGRYVDGTELLEPVEIENTPEGWRLYYMYRNPFGYFGMPDLNEDGRLNSQDVSWIRVDAANEGAGRTNLASIWTNYTNSRDAARVATFSANQGSGTIWNKYATEDEKESEEDVSIEEFWKRYVLDMDEQIKDLYSSEIFDKDFSGDADGQVIDSEIKIKILTQDEYDRIQKKSNRILYVIKEDEEETNE